MKKILKIGISLLIALCFLLPTSAVIADGSEDAEDIRDTISPLVPEKQLPPSRAIGRVDSMNTPVIEQDTNTDIVGVYFGECDSNAMMEIDSNGKSIIPLLDCYELWFELNHEGPSTFEPEIEIYKVDTLEEYCLYETSFEDNADNYINWQQIDADCDDAGGYYDGWSWSTQRACGSEHSFKCSMYDEYKNMQEDILLFEGYLEEGIDLNEGQFDLCDGTTMDIDPDYVKVDFDVYVDGEAVTDEKGWCDYQATPLDYLLGGLIDQSGDWVPITPSILKDGGQTMFRVGDSNCIPIDDGNQVVIWDTNGPLREIGEGSPAWDWTAYTGESCEPNCPDLPPIYAEKKSDCPGWWHVSYVLDVDALPSDVAEQFKPAFKWNSDKERVFEGAYIDNVEINVLEPEGNKIYQGHSQEWLTEDQGRWFKFPLDWDDDIEETFAGCETGSYDANPDYYNMRIKLKNDSGGFAEDLTFKFEIGNQVNYKITDLSIEDDYSLDPIEDGGVLQYPSDAHIMFCFENSDTVTGCDQDGNPVDMDISNMEPATDVKINAKGYKMEKETLFEDDFDGMFNWGTWDDPEGGFYPMYVSDFEPWSGSGCLALNNPENNMILGGDWNKEPHPDAGINFPEQKVRYAGYSQEFFSMENVEEATMDFYLKGALPEGAILLQVMIGSKYILWGEALVDTGNVIIPYLDMNGDIIGYSDYSSFFDAIIHDADDFPPGQGEWCQKTWLGPMQPQGEYVNIDIASQFRDNLAAGYFKDANGHDTYETTIGFYLFTDCVDKDQIYPECCFGFGETPYSGAFFDDISIEAEVIGDEVWSDSMIIPGPCEPGDECCTEQFVWEDVPYSHYKVVVEVEGDCDMSFEEDKVVCNEDTSDNWLDSDFKVLDECEHPRKYDDVDHTECSPEAWCISDVVGNDCGDDGTGDHYALATNCDEAFMPGGVLDTIGFGMYDVSHNWPEPTGDDDDDDDDACEDYVQAPCDDPDTEGTGPFSDTVSGYRAYDDIVGPYGPCEVDHVSFWGLCVYGDDSPDGNVFNIGFFEDAGGMPGTAIQDEAITISDYTFYMTWLGYSIWQIDADVTPVVVEAGDWFSAQMDDALEQYACLDDDPSDPASGNSMMYHEGAGVNPYDLSWHLGVSSVIGASLDTEYTCEVALDEGFEDPEWETDPNYNGWENTGWLWDLAGNDPCEGDHYLAQFSAGTRLTTPEIDFGNSSNDDGLHPATVFTFQYYKESAAADQDINIYLDYGTAEEELVDSFVITETDCTTYSIEFDNTYEGLHTLSVVLETSGFYGTVIDDFVVETCDSIDVEPPTDPGTHMFLNMTYQSDLSKKANVYVQWAFVGVNEDGTCEGCEPGEECPSGLEAWDSYQLEDTNKICTEEQIDLGIPPIGTALCLRILLDTDATVADKWHENGFFRGIGLHIHEMGITNMYNVSLPENAPFEYKDAMWDFEDSDNFYTNLKVPSIDEGGFYDTEEHRELGDVTLNRDCVTFSVPVKECLYDDVLWTYMGVKECAETVPYPDPDTWTIMGQDSWGDGWDSAYTYTPDAFVDIYVNGVLVIDDFTVTGSMNMATFDVSTDDTVEISYTSAFGWFEGEHSWTVSDSSGDVYASYAGTASAPFTVTVESEDIPEEVYLPAELSDSGPVDQSLVYETDISDAYYAELSFDWDWNVPKGGLARVQLSADGGDNWYTIDEVDNVNYNFNGLIAPDDRKVTFDLTPWAGSEIMIRLHIKNVGYELWDPNTNSIHYRTYDPIAAGIANIYIDCKTDMLPPTATVSLSGDQVGPGMYAGPVTVTINAVDDMGMGEIHYTLDGEETVVSGNKATFKVSDDGDHTVTFYPVDATGNVGSTGSVSFSIDNSPPTVEITAPEPGLYLFGNKLLSMNKPFIIGAFTAGATADDAQGVAVVKFMLNGEVVAEDTEAPYDAYIAQKNMGGATLKVVAEDGVGNTAEDSMDITYYKFL